MSAGLCKAVHILAPTPNTATRQCEVNISSTWPQTLSALTIPTHYLGQDTMMVSHRLPELRVFWSRFRRGLQNHYGASSLLWMICYTNSRSGNNPRMKSRSNFSPLHESFICRKISICNAYIQTQSKACRIHTHCRYLDVSTCRLWFQHSRFCLPLQTQFTPLTPWYVFST